MHTQWSQFVPNTSTDIRRHEAPHHHHQPVQCSDATTDVQSRAPTKFAIHHFGCCAGCHVTKPLAGKEMYTFSRIVTLYKYSSHFTRVQKNGLDFYMKYLEKKVHWPAEGERGRGEEMEGELEGLEQERQTDRQTHRETETETDRQRQTNRQRDTQTHRHTERQRHRQTDRQRQRERATETDRQTDRQAKTY